MNSVKICTSCNIQHPKTTDYFYRKTIKNKLKSGEIAIYYSFRSICKSCYDAKTQLNRKRKRCEEMGCEIDNYRKYWKQQYSETRTIDIEAKSKLNQNQYSWYRQLKRNGVINNVEEYINRISNGLGYKEMGEKKRKSIEHHRQYRREYYREYNKNLPNSLIANLYLKAKVSEIPNEIIETTRLLIQLKRLLKSNHSN